MRLFSCSLLSLAFCAVLSADANGTIRIMAVGDMMLGTSYPTAATLPPRDKNILENAAPTLREADITIGNLEGAMTDGGRTTKCKDPASKRCFTFRMPTKYAAFIADAGFDVMTLANNHALDFGLEGIKTAEKTLEKHGIAHTGRVGDIARLSANGASVSVIGFATYGNLHNLNDLAKAREIVKSERAKSDLVIVVMHGGAEGGDKTHTPVSREFHLGEDRGDLRAFARAAIDAGAALVIGHGPHVPRGLEIYRDRLIAYSLGNFATYEMMNLAGDRAFAPILDVQIDLDGKFLRGKIHSFKQAKPGVPMADPASGAAKLMAKVSSEDFGKNAPIFTQEEFVSAGEK
ncbi:metallophosphatase [Campylobacterota bacterium]|nr:metallophosphatase [Campylobacterota bacterium]